MSNLIARAFGRLSKPAVMARLAVCADAFLVSFPKSGRTWFRFLLAFYFADLLRLGFAPDLRTMFSIVPNFDADPVWGMPAFAFSQYRPRLPLVSVSHLEHKRRLFLDRPVIFMARDPRDVMVSSYFHATRHKHRFSGDMDRFISDREQGLPSLVRYLNGWAAGLAGHRSVVLSYEGLSADPEAEMMKVLDFLACPIDPAALRRAVEAGRFQSMRDQELSIGLPAHEYDRHDNESLRMRRGKVGGFEDYLSRKQISFVETTCARDLSPPAKRLLATTSIAGTLLPRRIA